MQKVTIKPWGSELLWAETKDYASKLLYIKAGESLSLQYHEIKEESILVLNGRMKMHWQPEGEPVPIIAVLSPGDEFHIPPKLIHRMEAIDDVFVLEVSTPQLDDVVRLEDRYGRVGSN